MFKDHSDIVWGTYCQCGSSVYILQNKFHPWDRTDFAVRIPCPTCGKLVDVDGERAAAYYNQKILSRFSDVRGTVLDLGCGGGFLTEHVLTLPEVARVVALDNDPDCKEAIEALADPRVEFVLADAGELGKLFAPGSIDYIISRDVYMFIADTSRFHADLTRIVRRGIRQMGWYKPSTQRMKNLLTPEEIRMSLSSLDWIVELEYLDWYKSGYFVRAER